MAKPFRLYVCSDIHASERAWRKLLNATASNVYGVDAVLIAGDLTGKALIPIVQQLDGTASATLLGARRVARSEAELLDLERSIADVGYSRATINIADAGTHSLTLQVTQNALGTTGGNADCPCL